MSEVRLCSTAFGVPLINADALFIRLQMEDVLNQKESIHMIILCKFLKALGRRMRDMIGIAYHQVGFQTFLHCY